MLKDTTVIRLRQPDAIDDPLSELAREGARRMLAQALIAEADAFVALRKDLKLPDGRDRIVRHRLNVAYGATMPKIIEKGIVGRKVARGAPAD
jgi:hypothetical protein